MSHSVAPVIGEPTTDDHVGLVKGFKECRHLGGVVLAVSVELVRPVVALVCNMAEAKAQRPADPQIEGQSETGGSASHRGQVRAVR
ncbi:MAG: hypothetical protein CM1200mP26_12270 [Acidimicrobiales bacterium]|nr:MAG: hypothetical protein CM1200mP26_12270 [Acidimicrobiales bacterium]